MTREKMEKELAVFNDKIMSFIDQLEPVVLDIEKIKGSELLGFLYSQVTSEFKEKVKYPDYPYIDEILGMNEFDNKGKYSKINDNFVACVSISEFPEMDTFFFLSRVVISCDPILRISYFSRIDISPVLSVFVVPSGSSMMSPPFRSMSLALAGEPLSSPAEK